MECLEDRALRMGWQDTWTGWAPGQGRPKRLMGLVQVASVCMFAATTLSVVVRRKLLFTPKLEDAPVSTISPIGNLQDAEFHYLYYGGAGPVIIAMEL